MDDAGERTHRACGTVGADNHPTAQGLDLALTGDRHARQVGSRQIESDDAGAMPYRHVAESRGGSQEGGADRAVIEPGPRAAMWKNAEPLDGYCIGQADTIVEAEFDEAGHAWRMNDLARQTAFRTLSWFDD